jgi:hypothetical protein
MTKTLEDIKIVSTSKEIVDLIEEANFYLLCADKSIKSFPPGKERNDLFDCLSETAMEFVYELNNTNANATLNAKSSS